MAPIKTPDATARSRPHCSRGRSPGSAPSNSAAVRSRPQRDQARGASSSSTGKPIRPPDTRGLRTAASPTSTSSAIGRNAPALDPRAGRPTQADVPFFRAATFDPRGVGVRQPAVELAWAARGREVTKPLLSLGRFLTRQATGLIKLVAPRAGSSGYRGVVEAGISDGLAASLVIGGIGRIGQRFVGSRINLWHLKSNPPFSPGGRLRRAFPGPAARGADGRTRRGGLSPTCSRRS